MLLCFGVFFGVVCAEVGKLPVLFTITYTEVYHVPDSIDFTESGLFTVA